MTNQLTKEDLNKVKPESLVKLRLIDESDGSGESVWAEPLGEEKFRIRNIPLAVGYNILDTVETERIDGRLQATKLVERPVMHKTSLQYDKSEEGLEEFRQLAAELEQNELVFVEGMVLGFALVAYPENFDFEQWCGEHDIDPDEDTHETVEE